MVETSKFPAPGDLLAGKYRIEREIGRGGMSVVFGATHQVTGRRFAIKWLLPEVAVQAGAAQRFVREAQISGRLQHPHVVEVFDIGEDAGRPYMVMEWLEGETLAERLERCGRLTLSECSAVLLPCMRGVAAVHAAGIIHRDLKPANVFLTRATAQSPESVKVLDFGISKLIAQRGVDPVLTSTGALVGTPNYMSPEQMEAQTLDPRTDVYAFGVMLYETLSGRRPFEADSYAALVIQVTRGMPRSLCELVPELPRAVGDCVANAMSRDPEDRYPDLLSLASAFERAASSGPLHPERRSSVGAALLGAALRTSYTPWTSGSRASSSFARRSQRRRVYIGVSSLAALLLAVLILVWFRGREGASPEVATAAGRPPSATVVESLAAAEGRLDAPPTLAANAGAPAPHSELEAPPVTATVANADPEATSPTPSVASERVAKRRISAPRVASHGHAKVTPKDPDPPKAERNPLKMLIQ